MSPQLVVKEGVRIAVEGCGHGTLHSIYASIKKACELNEWPGIDLLIIGGDFQAVRNAHDLNCMSVPVKYREIGDFWQYYAGIRKAPYLTIFIAGNHEAANHLFELYYGGWAAPNIYYMGAANVLRLGPLRIAGLSGIWKGHDYRKSHFERLPYNQDDVKTAYHVREFDTRKLLQIRTQVDIGLSHDWPKGIEWKGDYKWLFRRKPDFETDARSGRLGSDAAKQVLERLRPPYWFSAHLHIKYSAIVEHQGEFSAAPQADSVKQQASLPSAPLAPAGIKNKDEIDLDLDSSDPPASAAGAAPSHAPTNQDEIDLDLEDDTANPTSNVTETPLHPAAEVHPTNAEEIDLDLEDDEKDGGVALNTPKAATGAAIGATTDSSTSHSTTGVSQDLRALLPASFTRPTVTRLPFPPGISNKTTKFLSLDKCLPNRDFLQLLTIAPLAEEEIERPLKLEYDPEWLAITRVFASDLTVGEPTAHVPADRGEAHYRPLIEREEAWVQEHVIKAGKLGVPDNFEVTAPVYDEQVGWKGVMQQPREYSNNQTRAFCELLEIPNPFHASEEEIAARMSRGPRPEEPRWHGGGGRGRGGRGGAGHGRGGRGRGSRRGFNPNREPIGSGRGRA